MHPQLLAIDGGCSGGTCPAVYDVPDLLPDGLAIVGEGIAPTAHLRSELADRMAPHEDVVVIKRAIVADALRPADEPVDITGLMRLLEGFEFSAFRLETLQHYVGTGRDDQWVELVKAGRRFGSKAFQRVHVVMEPLSEAMQQELTEGYGPNVAAGEDIRIVPIGDDDYDWPDGVPQADFWLFDGCVLLEMDYDPDGSWAGARRVRDPERVVAACRAREVALHHAESWHTYLASRPDLKRHLAQ